MMTVFDRIQNFSARQPKPTGLFDISTPEGAFLDRVHNAGFKLIDENGAYTELYTALTCKGNQVINAVAGSGKALRNGTGVFTKLGYKAIETLSIGEFIASDDGLFYTVEGVFPQGFKSLWNMYYEDGNAIPCTADHLWKVSIDYNTGVYTTEQILEKLNAGSLCTIPVTKPVVLGDNVIPNAEAFGKSLANYILYDTDFTFNLDILYSDIDSRQSFFNGFIDALGGNVFEAVEYQLCEWIIYLAESMGYVVTVYEGELGVDKIKIDRDLSERRIVRIEQTNEVCEFTCISVGSPDHIFLTEHFIPTHNTTALTLKVLHDMVTGESMVMKSINGGTPIRVANGIWVCTFLKSGAVELQESLEKWQRKFGYSVTASQVNFSTMDAEFKRVLNAMGVATPIGDTFSCLKKAVDTCNIKRDGNPLSKEDYNIISGILIYYRGRLDQSKYEHPSASDYGLTPTMLDMVARQFALNRQAQGIMDFEEVMEVLYKYLYLQPNAAVQDFISNRYNYIYIDEFQDTSQMAYAILKFYLRGKLALNNNNAVSEDLLYNGVSTLGKATFVGDVSQCLVEGTPIEVFDTVSFEHKIKPIEHVIPTDKVRTATGYGSSDYCLIDTVDRKAYRGKVLKITTASGKEVTVTPRHKMFVYNKPKQGVYFVYLMYKKEFGFRIGQTQGVRSEELKNGYELRLRQETASKIWLLKQCVSKEEATYWEVYYSLIYSIPQYVFVNKSTPDFTLTTEYVKRLHKAVDSYSNGMRCLRDFDLDFDFPMYTASGEVNNVIRLSYFDATRGDSSLTAQFTYPCIEETCVSSIIRGRQKKATSTGNFYNYYCKADKRIEVLEALYGMIKDELADYPESELNLVIQARLLKDRTKFTVTTASQLKWGMSLCSVAEDGTLFSDDIVDIQECMYDGYVYDINISSTRNFAANGIIVHNCIYSFRGSDSTILGESVLADFNPSITALSVNWRCPSNILNPVVQSIHHNEDSAKQVIKSAKEGGVFNALKYPSVKAMCEALKEGILQDLASYHSIAIICRTNFDGLIPALMLESDGTFNFSISGENMTLTSALPRNLVGVACLFTERTSNAVKQALEWVAGRQGYWEVKALMEVLKTNKVSVWQLPEEDLNYSCKSLTPFITAMRKIFMADGVRHADLEVEALKAVYMYLYNEVFAYDSLYNMNARAIIESLMHILDSNNFNSVHEYLEEISFLGDKLTARIKKSGATIKIVTVHEAKGKEYDSVYVWNDSDGIFPTNKCDLQNKSQVAEERRVHYIACTRAKQKLSVLALSGKLGIFAKEMDCEFKSAGVGVISL